MIDEADDTPEQTSHVVSIPSAHTLEDMEKLYATPEAEKPQPPTVFDGDDIPAAVRGKSIADVAAELLQLQQAFQLSESARVALMRQQVPAPAAPSPQPQVKVFSREEINELMASDDPAERAQAVDIITTQAINAAKAEYSQHMGQLSSSLVQTAMNNAQYAYPDEFALFGDQIQALVDQMPDKSQLSSPTAWKQLVAYVRGQDGNVQRYAQHIATKSGQPQQFGAPQLQLHQGGFSPAPVRAPKPNTKSVVVDEMTREIARVFGRDPVEYAREIRAIDT